MLGVMSNEAPSSGHESSRALRTPEPRQSSARPARAAESAAVGMSIIRLVAALAIVLAEARAPTRTADPAADSAAAADEVDDRRNGCRMCKRRRRRRAALFAVCGVVIVLVLYAACRRWPSLDDSGEERRTGVGDGLPFGRLQPAALTPLEPPPSDAVAACTGYDGRQWPPHANLAVDGARHCIAELRALTQSDVDLMAQSLTVSYAVVSNFKPNGAYSFRVTLENKGSRPVGGVGWEIYFCNVHMLFPDANLRGNASRDVGYGLRVANANGCLFRLFPGAGSVVFEGGRSVVLDMVAENWVVAKSDVMPNWYVAAPNTLPKVIANTITGSDFTAPFDGPEKWKRRLDDRYNPIAPHERFSYYEPTYGSDGDAPVRPLPTPKKMVVAGASAAAAAIDLGVQSWLVEGLDDQLRIAFPMANAFVRDSLRGMAKPDGGDCSAGVLCLRFVANSTFASGHYGLSTADPRTVAVHASDDVGALAAAKTLYQFKVAKARFGSLQVDDGPRFGYRGVMLDIVRNFQSTDVIKRLIDVASLYKLNRLHLRLADDEGWRLQIDGLPELTEVAGRTCYDPTETVCILPEFGAVPDGAARFLTRTDYLDLLEYAEGRDIQIVPEFDMPGHSRAAIKAMEARYRKLVGHSVAAAEEYLLSDLQDTSIYRSIQLYTDNAMNPCLNSTYRFIRKVVSTVQRYYMDVGQQLSFIHMGGDEVPEGAWVNSSACRPLLATRPSAYRDSRYAMLKKSFVTSLYAIMSEAGLGLALWEDGFMDEASSPFHLEELRAAVPSGVVPQPVYAFVWQNVWEWLAAGRAYRLANAGYKVILMPATHFYFDHPQEPDPDERGFYWATRFTGTNKTFGFMPGDMYANIELDLSRFGAPLSRTTLCPSDKPLLCPTLNAASATNIIGVQGGVFAETCRTETDLHGLMFPRLIALAERAWHEAAWESIRPETSAGYYAQRNADWREFAAAVGRQQLPMLAAKGIEYHLSPPGVKNSGGTWLANTEFPGQTIQYSTDGGLHWLTYNRSSPPTGDPILFSIVDASGNAARQRRSRVIAFGRSSSSAFVSSSALLLCALAVLLVIR